jgi:predicted nucleic acid-binding protein
LSEVFLLDSGALGALAEDDPRMRCLLEAIVRDGGSVRVPVIVLAECYGDARYNARYDRALTALGGADRCVVAVTPDIAKEAGRIRREAGFAKPETVDAIVVAAAASFRGNRTIVTGDSAHIELLACCVEPDIGIIYLNDLPAR